MDTRVVVIGAIVVIAVIVIAVLVGMRKRRSELLKHRFGPEYDRTLLKQRGNTGHAEAVLAERQKRVEKFSIRPLGRDERERYIQAWSELQRRFVDDPSFALTEADKLVTIVMAARGYPMADFEQSAADVSVNYPGVVQNYRSARTIVVNRSQGQATTEDLRQAMVYFRSLFDELLDSAKPEQIGVPHERAS